MGRSFVAGNTILELGAGTGFLSILCAKHLSTKYVLATDGSEEVINDLESNICLNGLDNANRLDAEVLKWGHPPIVEVTNDHEKPRSYDLILGADIVSVTATARVLFVCCLRYVWKSLRPEMGGFG